MLQGWTQIALTLLIVVAITPVFGRYMARIYQEQRTVFDPLLNPVERLIYVLIGVQTRENMTGWQYARAILYSNLVMGLFVFLLMMNQGWLPLNPTNIGAPTWDTALHTAISFITNTNQQHYSGETSLSYGSQMFGLGYHMFTSAATGLAVAITFIRGLTGRPLGNFYVDLTRTITRILLPICIVGGIALMAAGVPETLAGPIVLPTIENPNISQAIARALLPTTKLSKNWERTAAAFLPSTRHIHLRIPTGFPT